MQNSARIGTNIEIGRPIVIGDTERRSGMYVLGRPGTGKTSLLVNLMTQDIANGHGLFFLDPHGDAIKDVLKGVDDNREGSIFVLDPADGRFTFGINLLACQDINSFNGRKDTYDRCRWVFEKVFATKEVWGPLLQLIIEYTLPVFIENQEFTLAEVPLFLRDQAFRNHLLHNVKYADESREFWEYEFPMRERDQQELVAPAQRRVRILLGDERVRHIIGQRRSTLDFASIMAARQGIFLKLGANIAPDIGNFIGTILLSELVHAVRRRDRIALEKRHQFCVFVDEVQNFATSHDLGTLITEARKFGVATTIAHQERYGQLADNRAMLGATAAAGNMVCFQLTTRDAQELAPEFARRPSDEIVRRGAELVLSPHPAEDVWQREHPNEKVMKLRQKYLHVVEHLKSSDQLFPFNPSRVRYQSPFSGVENRMRPDWQSFSDFGMYQSSKEMLTEGVSRLNKWIYDWEVSKRQLKGVRFSENEIDTACEIVLCIGGLFGWLPTMLPHLTDVGKQAIMRGIRTNSAQSSQNLLRLLDEQLTQALGDPYGLRGHRIPRKWLKAKEIEEEILKANVDLTMHQRGETFSVEEGQLDRMTEWYPYQANELKRLAVTRLNITPYEADRFFEWRERKPFSAEVEALRELVHSALELLNLPSLEAVDREQQAIDKPYMELLSDIYSYFSGEKKADFVTLAGWQVTEIRFFIQFMLIGFSAELSENPVLVPSSSYEEPKREKSQLDMNMETVQELINLPRFTAYAKVLQERENRQEVWKGRIGTDPMPGASKDFWGDALGDAKSQLALVNAIEAGLLRSREAIDEEIRERRNRWRGGSSGGPNKPPTGWD